MTEEDFFKVEEKTTEAEHLTAKFGALCLESTAGFCPRACARVRACVRTRVTVNDERNLGGQ